VSGHLYKGNAPTWGRPSAGADPLRESFRKLEQAEAFRQQGEAERARVICESLVSRFPDYFGALYTLGLVYVDLSRYPQALGCLVRAAMLNPRSWRALTALSAVYLELGAREMAAHTLEQARLIKPGDPNILVTLGEIYREEREYELARDAYAKSFELDGSLDAAALGLGACCAHLGQYAQAAEIFEGMLKREKRSASVFFELSNLPAAFVTVDLLSELQKFTDEQKQNQPDVTNSVAFLTAALLDRAGRYEEAWDHLVAANRTLHQVVQRDAQETAETERTNLAQLKRKRVKVRSGGGRGNRTISLFILGPSRSGKTTMETLVATLDGVKRGYENPSVENAIRRASQSAGLLTTSMFEVLPPTLNSECRDIYLEELSRRAGSAKVFTNTHPGRIHDAARVAAAFPNVRFIFVKRNLQDNMLRIYMRKYLTGNSYAYDLRSVKDHITWYHRMFDVLAEKLPGRVRIINYEDMVVDPAGALRMAADLCGLPMPEGPLPEVGDDRGCAEPYRELMAAALEG